MEKVRFTTDPSLVDHKRHKKRLVAPWNIHPEIADNFKAISWHQLQMPQVIWIAELINDLGPDGAVDCLLSFGAAGYESSDGRAPMTPFLASSWIRATDDLKKKHHRNAGFKWASDLSEEGPPEPDWCVPGIPIEFYF